MNGASVSSVSASHSELSMDAAGREASFAALIHDICGSSKPVAKNQPVGG